MPHPTPAALRRLIAPVALLLATTAATLVQAQPASPEAARLEQKLEQSLRLIQALTSRVEQLEKQLVNERKALNAEMEEKKEKVRAGK